MIPIEPKICNSLTTMGDHHGGGSGRVGDGKYGPNGSDMAVYDDGVYTLFLYVIHGPEEVIWCIYKKKLKFGFKLLLPSLKLQSVSKSLGHPVIFEFSQLVVLLPLLLCLTVSSVVNISA